MGSGNSCFDNVLITVMKMAVISNQNVDYFVQILERSIKIKSSLKINDVTLSLFFIVASILMPLHWKLHKVCFIRMHFLILQQNCQISNTIRYDVRNNLKT